MPYYDGDETREERDRREERHRISQKRISADNQALTEASGHLIVRLLLIPFKCILKLTLWSSRHAWRYGWRLAQRLYFTAQPTLCRWGLPPCIGTPIALLAAAMVFVAIVFGTVVGVLTISYGALWAILLGLASPWIRSSSHVTALRCTGLALRSRVYAGYGSWMVRSHSGL